MQFFENEKGADEMFRKVNILFLLAGVTFFAASAFAGRVELTTYYPAPQGDYNAVQVSQKLKVPYVLTGTKNFDKTTAAMPGEIWVEGASCPSGTAVSGYCP